MYRLYYMDVSNCYPWEKGWARAWQQIQQVGWHNSSLLINIPIPYYHFIVRTTTITYNNKHQQKREKGRGEEVIVVLLFAWFPSNNVLFIAPIIHISPLANIPIYYYRSIWWCHVCTDDLVNGWQCNEKMWWWCRYQYYISCTMNNMYHPMGPIRII